MKCPVLALPKPGIFYISSNLLEIASPILQAASSTLVAALAASLRVGLFLGIIITATAPAAAPKPSVIAHPVAFIKIPPFDSSIPDGIFSTQERFFSLQAGKTMLQ
jgi:hypothetical protein